MGELPDVSPFESPYYALCLLAALVLGALIGLERQLQRHPAGMHTNALIAFGAAIYMIAALLIGDETGPARVAGQVVTGIGFLCAAVIFRQGLSVRGMNTAATMWCASGVGVLAGLGYLLWATMVAVLVVLANTLLHVIEKHFLSDDGP
jgi:putative Mg2+ transporter-C (MgtC) family protein